MKGPHVVRFVSGVLVLVHDCVFDFVFSAARDL